MNFKTSIWSPKKWVVVFVHFAEEQVEINALIYGQKDKTEPTGLSFDSFEEVVKHFGKSKPYVFHVTGSGVLSRKIDFLPGYKEQLIVNADKDDFYFTSFNDGSSIIVSFFRKNLIESYVNLCKDQKIPLQSISSGIVPVLNLAGSNEKIMLDYTISIQDGKLIAFDRQDKIAQNTSINHHYFSRLKALCSGVVLSLINSNEHYEQALDLAESKQQIDEFVQFRKFKFWGVSSLLFIFISLAANYIYMSNLNNEIAQLELDLSIDNYQLTLLDHVTQEKGRKESLVASSGVDTKQFISFYIDAIASSIPKEIKFKTMEVYPLDTPLKAKRKVEINQTHITIIGSTPNSYILEDWMDKINRYEWVKSVELMNYLKSNQQASFKLIIQIDK